MRVLITGGAGFIGSHLAEHFQGRAEVRVLDDLSTGRRENLDGLAVDFLQGSILDPAQVARAVEGVDLVFHLAAMVSVAASVERPEECARLNIDGLRNVLEAAAAAGVGRFGFASSAAVYGDEPAVPTTENHPPAPLSPYAQTKWEGEAMCRDFHGRGPMQTVAFRFFNAFGPRQDPASTYAAAVPRFVVRALRGEPLTVHGDGGQTRDFVYVRDLVAACAFLGENPAAAGVFNIGYGVSTSVNALVRDVLKLTGSASAVGHTGPRPGDVRHSLAAVDKLAAAGFRPAGDLRTGLAETVAYLRPRAAALEV